MHRFLVLLATVSAFASEGELPSAAPKDLSQSSWLRIRAEHQRHRQAAIPDGNGYRARNYGQHWRTHFDGRGFHITPDTGGWQWGLQLNSYGFPGQERAVQQARLRTDVEKVSYQWDSEMTEWFINESRGLEHGFTLQSRPGSSAAALVLHLAVRGTLTPLVSPDKRQVNFLDARGAPALRYAGLKVTDALGQELDARFTAEPGGLRLEVDEHNARYPITIDPIVQQAYLKPAAVGTTQVGDWFGYAVAVSGDTVVVGALQEDSSSVGVNSTPNELAAGSAGAAYVFTQTGGVWSQQAYLKPAAVGPGGQAGDHFGHSVAISGDTIVVGAPDEDSSTTGVNTIPAEGSTNSGAAYVFIRNGGTWSQQAYLKPTANQSGAEFGWSVAISGDTVVVGAYDESSSSTGVNSAPNLGAPGAGAAYVFARSGGVWAQQAYLKPGAVGTSQANDHFGAAVAVSGDTVVVGAFEEDSSSLGINSAPNDAAGGAGAAYVFVRTSGTWSQQAYLKPAAAAALGQAGHFFGTSVAISGDTIAVGANHESSSTLGVNTAPNDLSGASGAVYVFVRNAAAWSQQAYIKPAAVGATQNGDNFGYSVALTGDTLVVGAPGEASATLGINTTPNESASSAGAAYLFSRSSGVWSQQAYLKPAAVGTSQALDNFGWSVGVGGDWIVVGAYLEDSSTLGVNTSPNESAADSGAAYVFSGAGAGTGGDSKAVLTTPAGGATLSGSSITFVWSAGTGVTAYWLDVGTAPGQANIFGQNVGIATSQTVTGIPTDGSTIYVKLWTLLGGTWVSNEYTFKAAGVNTKAAIITPISGSTLPGASATFTWAASSGAGAYWLDVGSAVGQGNIFGQNVGLTTSQTVNGLPTNGSTVYVKLWTLLGGTWLSNDYTYKAAGGNTNAVITSPAPGSAAAGANIPFTWTAVSGATVYWLNIGTVPGARDLYDQSQGLATSKTVPGLPTDGSTLYVRLWTGTAAGYEYNDYTFKASGGSKAVMITPAASSVLTGTSATFTWNASAGATSYWLDVGSVQGGFNLFTQGVGLSTSKTVTGLPTGGATLYVRLWSAIGGIWQYSDSTYKAAP
jgi:hypothetical protein